MIVDAASPAKRKRGRPPKPKVPVIKNPRGRPPGSMTTGVNRSVGTWLSVTCVKENAFTSASVFSFKCILCNGRRNSTFAEIGAVKCHCISRKTQGLIDSCLPDDSDFEVPAPAVFRAAWHGYKRGAIERRIEFMITDRYLFDLFRRQDGRCALGGIRLTMCREWGRRTASLDRKNSSKGYTPGNVHWIHKDINLMKMSMPEDRFVDICHMVSQHQSILCRDAAMKFDDGAFEGDNENVRD